MEPINEALRKPIEISRREKLRREKPLVYEKIMQYEEKEKRGEPTCIIDFCYDYACNMRCAHCCNLCFEKKERALNLDDVAELSRQADALGLAQYTISGGEPLVFPHLDELVRALDPERFHLAMSTNGMLLTKERARHLKEIGIDKLKISLDSINEQVYDQTRQQPGAYDKAVKALFNAREAGLQVSIQTVVSHQTCQTRDTVRLAEFAHEYSMNLDVMAAKAIGRWEGKEEVLLTPEDAEYLARLHNQYPEVVRDVFPAYGKCGGCNAVNRTLHITKYGDVLPCGFIHIAIGNIFEEPLKDILDRGLRIKWFCGFRPTCLAGEDRYFIHKYMSKFYGKPLPISWREAFTAEDFIDGVMA